jgi:hypothetical protein
MRQLAELGGKGGVSMSLQKSLTQKMEVRARFFGTWSVLFFGAGILLLKMLDPNVFAGVTGGPSEAS